MTRISTPDLAAIRARYDAFSGPEGEAMQFEEYSELYDRFVDEDLPRLFEYLRAIEEERSAEHG